jgi:hypothetical protein
MKNVVGGEPIDRRGTDSAFHEQTTRTGGLTGSRAHRSNPNVRSILIRAVGLGNLSDTIFPPQECRQNTLKTHFWKTFQMRHQNGLTRLGER